MYSIQIGKREYVAGLVWRYPEKQEEILKGEIGLICSEFTESRDVFGVVIPARFEKSGDKELLLGRSGIGLVPDKTAEDEEFIKSVTRKYSLANAFALNYPNAIAIFCLDEASDTWWFSASRRGAPVPSMDVIGRRDEIWSLVRSFCNSEASVLYANHPHFTLLSDSQLIVDELAVLFDQSVTKTVGSTEKIFDSLSKPAERIAQIKGINQVQLVRVGLIVGIPLVLGALYFGGASLFPEPEPQPVPETPSISPEALKKIMEEKLAKEAESAESEKRKNQEAMSRSLKSKMVTELEKQITNKEVTWPISAINTVFKLPYQSNGYEFTSVECKDDRGCLVRWSVSGRYGDPVGFRKLLSRYSELHPVVNDFSAKWIEKRFDFPTSKNRIFGDEDLRKLPVLNFFLNEFIEKLNTSKAVEGVVDWKLAKPQRVPFYADLPFKGFKGDVLNDSYISGEFVVSLDRTEYIAPFVKNVLSAFPYAGIKSLNIALLGGKIQIKIGGTYVAASK